MEQYPRSGTQPYYNAAEPSLPSQPPYAAFVGNLPKQLVQGDVEKLFTQNVSGVQIQSIRLGKCRDTDVFLGHCFIEFDDQQSLRNALTLNGCLVDGRPLRVDVNTRSKGGSQRGRGRNTQVVQNRNQGPSNYQNTQKPGPAYDDRSDYRGRGKTYESRGFEPRRGNTYQTHNQYQNNNRRPSHNGNEQTGRVYTARPNYNESRGRSNTLSRDSGRGSSGQRREEASTERPTEDVRRAPRIKLQPRTIPISDSQGSSIDQITDNLRNQDIFGQGKPRVEEKQ